MKATRITTLLALMMLFGAKAFGQEWEQSYEYYTSENEITHMLDAYETSDGIVVASCCYFFKSGYGDFYSPHPALRKFSFNGEELAYNEFFKPAYRAANPYTVEHDGQLFALMAYNPDHDFSYFNYFLNYDNPPDDAILGLYKLDEQMNITECFEHHIKIDTFEVQNSSWQLNPNEQCGTLCLFSPLVDDGVIVGAYFKAYSHDVDHPRGPDSLFMFRMTFEGELIDQIGYESVSNGGGGAVEHLLGRCHLVKTDSGYLMYYPGRFNTTNASVQGQALYFDNNLNLLKTKQFSHTDVSDYRTFSKMSVARSRHGTTYLSTQIEREYGDEQADVRIYDYDDNIDDPSPSVAALQCRVRSTDSYDCPARQRSISTTNNDELYFCYTLNYGYFFNEDSWIMIERLDANLDTVSTLFYDLDKGNINSLAYSIISTYDGGTLLVFSSKNLDNTTQHWTTVTKFPADAFVGIEEAHENGLKVAIAYPNPGKDVLNIRTGLKNARVEVYDMNGRLIHSQALTENVTAIDATEWAEGVYVWKVYTTGVSTNSTTPVETGKWIKE